MTIIWVILLTGIIMTLSVLFITLAMLAWRLSVTL